MQRVLILANSSGGLYDFRNDFVLGLLKKYEVCVSVPDEVKTAELIQQGCQIVHTPINRRGVNPLEDFKLLLAYRKLMKEWKPDLVATYTIKPNIYGGMAAQSLGIPYIETITGLGGAFDRKGLFLKLIVTLYRIGLRKAECIFFQNRENRQIFRDFGIQGKSECLVNGSGVDLARHTMEPYPKRDCCKFLFVGRVMKERGILEYLAAARKLHSEQIQFDILGYCDEDYQQLLDELEQQGVIHQLGFHTEVHPFLADASAIVVASFHEGMSNALIEASATGRPVIASRISGCKEAFEEGITGYGFTPGKEDELIAAMNCFISLPWEEKAKMGREAREKMEREFDRKEVTASYLQIVQKVLN